MFNVDKIDDIVDMYSQAYNEGYIVKFTPKTIVCAYNEDEDTELTCDTCPAADACEALSEYRKNDRQYELFKYNYQMYIEPLVNQLKEIKC